MSVDNMTWVFKHSPYKLGARLVHLALADQADDDRSLVWLSQSTIASKAKVSRQTVNVILKQMVEEGWLEEITGKPLEAIRPLMKDKRTRVFRFLTTCRISDTSPEPRSVGSDDAMCRVSVRDVSGSQNRTSSRTQEEHKGLKDSLSPGLQMTAHAVSNGLQPPDLWEAFWGTYPRHVGKRKAEAAWEQALKRSDANAIIAGAARYSLDPNREDAYTAHPQTWLNRDGWEDDPLPSKVPERRDPTRRNESSLDERRARAVKAANHTPALEPVR